MIAKGGWVYIMSSHSRRLYIGVTSELSGRIWEHKNGVYESFTKKYKSTGSSTSSYFTTSKAPLRARNNSRVGRAKKIALIEKMNPGWEDLPPG